MTIKQLLDNALRTPCEIWSRVMGYHRPHTSYNTGKKGEVQERKYFKEHHEANNDKYK